MLVERQVDTAGAAEVAHPGAAEGAWFTDGVTQSRAGTATDPWTGVARFLAALGVLTGAGLLLDGILAL